MSTFTLPPTMLAPEIDPALGGRDRLPGWLLSHPAWLPVDAEPGNGPWLSWDGAWSASRWFIDWTESRGEPLDDLRLRFTGAGGLTRTAVHLPNCLDGSGDPLPEFAAILEALEGQHVELDDTGRGVVAVVKGEVPVGFTGPWSRDGVVIGAGPVALGGRTYGPPAADPPVDGTDALKLIAGWIRGMPFDEAMEEDRLRRAEEKRASDEALDRWLASRRGGKKEKPVKARPQPVPSSAEPEPARPEPVRPAGRRLLPWRPLAEAQLYPPNLASLADSARRGPVDLDVADEDRDFPTTRLPAELVSARAWVCWRNEDVPNKKGGTRRTKVLYRPSAPSRRAKTDDPSTWATHDEALAVYLNRLDGPPGQRFDGIGFVVPVGAGIVGVDFDKVLDADGRIADWARPMIAACIAAGAYGEPSPSGTGLKFWLRGSMPGDKGRRRSLGEGRGRPGVEIYPERRFFTVTGRYLWSDSRVIGDGQAAVDMALAWIDEPKVQARAEREARRAVLAAERARRATARKEREAARAKAGTSQTSRSSSSSAAGGIRPGFLPWSKIKPRVDLVAVCSTLLGEPERVDRWDGRAWWPCPFHSDSNPSFSVSPDVGLWNCFSRCGGGDAADFIMRLEDRTFPEAVKRLVRLLRAGEAGDGEVRIVEAAEPRTIGPDHDLARNLVDEAAERLWTPAGAADLDHLRGRGLTDETIGRFRLGSSDSFPLPARPGEEEALGRTTSGIVIPWMVEDRVEMIQVRRRTGEPRYLLVQKRAPVVYPSPEAIVPGLPLIFAEGELDALLLGQELAGVASVVTTGSAARGPSHDVLALAVACPRWFAAHDADEAGDRAAGRLPARAVRVRPEGGKDWTDVHKADPTAIKRIWGAILGF